MVGIAVKRCISLRYFLAALKQLSVLDHHGASIGIAHSMAVALDHGASICIEQSMAVVLDPHGASISIV